MIQSVRAFLIRLVGCRVLPGGSVKLSDSHSSTCIEEMLEGLKQERSLLFKLTVL